MSEFFASDSEGEVCPTHGLTCNTFCERCERCDNIIDCGTEDNPSGVGVFDCQGNCGKRVCDECVNYQNTYDEYICHECIDDVIAEIVDKWVKLGMELGMTR